jgi:hypothetical protein
MVGSAGRLQAIILSKVAKNVHPTSHDMIQTMILSLILLYVPPHRALAVPVLQQRNESVDPTVAPHLPKLPRMSTASSPQRLPLDPPCPNFLQQITPVRIP